MKIIFSFVIVLVCSACSKEVDLSHFEKEDKLVINSYLIADSTFNVYVGKTGQYEDTGDLYLNGLNLTIYDENNQALERLTNIDSGQYISQNMLIEEGRQYRITTEYNNKTVQSEQTVPHKKEIQNIRYTGNYVISEEGIKNIEFEIDFKDDPDKMNYYEISAQLKYTDSAYLSDTYGDPENIYPSYYDRRFNKYDKEYINSSDEVFINESYTQDEIYSAMVFTDELFNGTTKSIKLYYSGYILNNEQYFPKHSLKVYLKSTGKDYYFYKKTLMRHIDNQYSDFWYGTANPVGLYSNIQNGYGIFAAYTLDCDSILFNETKINK
jgi:hypothetical protein